jgi:5-methylcytosine-specific restriction endonuclease McrA
MDNSIPFKTCSLCKESLPATNEFFKNNGTRLSVYCVSCKKTYDKAFRDKNSERIKASEKAYRKAHPEKHNAHNRNWYANNREVSAERRKAYYEANIERVRKVNKKWRDANKDKKAAHWHKRRATILGNEHTPYTKEEMLLTYGTDCHVCGDPVDLNAPRQPGRLGWEKGLHIDHLVPVSKGGADSLANVRPSHGRCNLSKGSSV